MATDTIEYLQSQLASKKFAYLPAKEMQTLMGNFVEFSCDDEEEFEKFWNYAVAQRDESENEVYPYKGTLVSYFSMNIKKDFHSINRSSSHILQNDLEGRSIEFIDPTTAGEESKFRIHKQWPKNTDSNPIILGLLRILFAYKGKKMFLC